MSYGWPITSATDIIKESLVVWQRANIKVISLV